MTKGIRWVWLKQSLKIRLGLAFGITTLLLAIVLATVVGQVSQAHLKQNQGQFLAELAYQMADKLDRSMFERYRDIQILSTLNEFRNPQASIDRQRELLEKLQSTFTDYAWLGFIKQSGIIQAATGGLLEGQDGSKRPVFINAQSKPWVGDVHDAVLLAKLLPNPTGEPIQLVDVSAPVMDADNQQIGVLAAHLSWQWARGIEHSLLQPLQDRSQVEVFIVGQNSSILLSPKHVTEAPATLQLSSLQAAQAGQAGYQIESWFDSRNFLTGYAQSQGYLQYPGLGWTVLVRQPTAYAFAPARLLQYQILAWGVGLGIVFSGLGWLIANRVTRPILSIAAATDRFRRGDRTLHLPELQGQDEVAKLSRSLTKLFQTLTEQEYHLIAMTESLEQRVQARTAELTAVNADLQQEISNRLEAEQQLQNLAKALQNSNQELEQFAYVVSHDLQEPLRAIDSYTQLLARKYQGHLDEKADKYIHYVVDGATRMQQLIRDLLTYSRVGRQSLEFKSLDCNEILSQVCTNLQVAIAESQAVVSSDPLPTLIADPLRLTQLLQNLIGNAIKYRSELAPSVHISAKQSEQGWLFSVQDNGIGIDPQYAERIFVIFQRLHTRRNYSGTGIGLSICKKIVELHNGHIWVESQPENGSVFYFTLCAVS